jgi:hypothetical protein
MGEAQPKLGRGLEASIIHGLAVGGLEWPPQAPRVGVEAQSLEPASRKAWSSGLTDEYLLGKQAPQLSLLPSKGIYHIDCCFRHLMCPAWR